jgi:hypothetical protein
MENPSEIVRSWSSQSNWQTGPKVINKLVPQTFARISVPFVQSWRTQNLPTLDWGARDFSIIIPEGVRAISAAYLEIDIPAAQLKAYPGLYCIETFRIRSAGQVVYECDYADFLADHCESLQQQKLDNFARIYLGGKAATNAPTVSAVKLPLLLPNSTYMRRSSLSTAGHGIFGCATGNQRIELEISLNSNLFPGREGGTNDAPSIAGQCRIVYHTVTVPDNQRKKYEDLRGAFNVVTRRFTQLSSGWTHYANANSLVTDALSQPSGVCTEVMLLAVPHEATASDRRRHNYIQPTHFEVVHDMVTQKLLDTKRKVETENFVNGFNPPADFASPGRLCFASHCATDSTQIYTGGYDMSHATTLQFRFSFAEAVDYKLVAVQYANCRINGDGILTSTLDGI